MIVLKKSKVEKGIVVGMLVMKILYKLDRKKILLILLAL